MGRLLIFFGLIFFLLTITGNYFDISNHIKGIRGVTQIGHLWYQLNHESLQLSEVIISRYVDPCALEFLDCSGFLWHPIISSILTLPAGPCLAVISFLLIFLGLRKRSKQSRHRVL